MLTEKQKQAYAAVQDYMKQNNVSEKAALEATKTSDYIYSNAVKNYGKKPAAPKPMVVQAQKIESAGRVIALIGDAAEIRRILGL